MKIDNLELMEVARLAAIRTNNPMIEAPGPGVFYGLALGFLRAADVYSGDFDDKQLRRMGALAAIAGAKQPDTRTAMKGVEAAAVGLFNWAPGRPLSAAFTSAKCSHARAVGWVLQDVFEQRRRRPNELVLDGLGMSLFWMLRAASRLDLAPEVFLRMLGDEIVSAGDV